MQTANKDVQRAAGAISAERILEHIKVLASDEFEGRRPGTQGEYLSIDYLVKQCKQLGLLLGDPLGGYYQKIAVTGSTAAAKVTFTNASSSLAPVPLQDFVAHSGWQQEKTAVASSDVVFVGYGIKAPEYNWDDYKGIDVGGKTLIMLIGDPRRSRQDDPSKVDDAFFKGSALTYYGRWTYKYEIAFELGAAAVFIVHETDRAGYGFDVVQASWGGENYFLTGEEKRAAIEGWLSPETAKKLFALGGHNYEQLKASAQTGAFRPLELGVKVAVDSKNKLRHFSTCNVLGKIEGSDPALKDECVIYCAHWDHFGKKENSDGSVSIYSGATDNGSGVAGVLEMARAFTLLPQAPRRSILFLFTTLEESGLLGAAHYVREPAMPLAKTSAIINLDSMNMWGRTRKFISIAQGHSSLDEVLSRNAALQGRQIAGDPDPAKGFFFRSDHLEFLRHGVPALFALNPGDDFIDRPAEYGVQKREHYIAHDYHKVSDKVKSDWDLGGIVEDCQLLFVTGFDVAQADQTPKWSTQSEFRHVRRLLQPI